MGWCSADRPLWLRRRGSPSSPCTTLPASRAMMGLCAQRSGKQDVCVSAVSTVSFYTIQGKLFHT